MFPITDQKSTFEFRSCHGPQNADQAWCLATADPRFFEMDAREPLKGSTVSLTRKIEARTRVIKSWIMLYFGRATGNQHLESKGLAGRPENNMRQRSRKTKGMFKH